MVKRIVTLWAIVLALPGVLALPSVARATPPDTIGFGSRPTAMGGAVTSHVESVSANYYNPAGIVRGDGLRIGAGYQFSVNNHQINGVPSNIEPIRGVNFGIAAPVTLGGFRFGFGLGVHLNDNRLSRTRSAVVSNPRWELYDTRPHRVWLAATIAARPTDWLLLGAGITFQSASDLRLDLRGTADVLRPESSSRLEHEFQGDLRAIRYPVLGAQFLPTSTLSFGVAYRGSYSLKNFIRASVDIDLTGFGDPIPAFFALDSAAVATFGPQQVAMGMTWQPNARWTLSAEVTWVDWSAYLSPVADEEVTLRIDVPPELAGLIHTPGDIEGRTSAPLMFEDRWVPRVGVEWLAVQRPKIDLHLRAGYFYEQTPFPEQRGLTSFLDSDRHSMSMGAGLTIRGMEPTLPGSLRLDIHFQYNHLPERLHERDSLVNPVGDLRAGGQQFAGGVHLEVDFE